jgi:hypothetical protein
MKMSKELFVIFLWCAISVFFVELFIADAYADTTTIMAPDGTVTVCTVDSTNGTIICF